MKDRRYKVYDSKQDCWWLFGRFPVAEFATRVEADAYISGAYRSNRYFVIEEGR